jgi:hypothetical protein
MTHVIAVVKSSMTAYPEVDALPMARSCLTAQRLPARSNWFEANWLRNKAGAPPAAGLPAYARTFPAPFERNS